MELSYRTLAAGAAYLFISVTRIQGAGAYGARETSFGQASGPAGDAAQR